MGEPSENLHFPGPDDTPSLSRKLRFQAVPFFDRYRNSPWEKHQSQFLRRRGDSRLQMRRDSLQIQLHIRSFLKKGRNAPPFSLFIKD